MWLRSGGCAINCFDVIGALNHFSHIVRRKQHSKLPQRVITACEEHIEAETGLKMRLWEKCLLCGEKLAACTCANAQEPCLDCGETFARCMCDGQ